MNEKFNWTGQLFEELRRLLALRLSGSTIAFEIGKKFHLEITRNMVIGAISRAQKAGKLPPSIHAPTGKRPRKGEGVPQAQEQKPEKVSIPRIRLLPLPEVFMQDIDDDPIDSLMNEPKLKTGPNPSCNLQDLTKSTCRWPLPNAINEPPYLYCGELPIEGFPYCDKHCRQSYSEQVIAKLDKAQRAAR